MHSTVIGVRRNVSGQSVLILEQADSGHRLLSVNTRYAAVKLEEVSQDPIPVNLVLLTDVGRDADPIMPEHCLPFGRGTLELSLPDRSVESFD